MKITLNSNIQIMANSTIEKQIIKQFTFANPKYQSAENFGRSTYNIEKSLCLLEYINDQLYAPIGPLDYLLKTFNPEIQDNRATVSASIPFNGELRPYQEQFINTALHAKGGQCIATTGAGKTVCAIAMASRLKQRSLILVKSKDLAKQWQDAIKQFTGLECGLIGGGKNTEGEQFTIGLTQTLCKRDVSLLNYGLVIADECHNLPANQAYTVINGLNARYKYGLSATPQRRDNMEFMIKGAVGGKCAGIDQDQLQGKVLPVTVTTIKHEFNTEKVLPVTVTTIKHEFNTEVDSWTGFINALVDDESRNLIIVDNAIKASKAMGTIILCSQVRHCELLANLFRDRGVNALTLHGQLPTKERAQRLNAAPNAQLIISSIFNKTMAMFRQG